MKFSTVLLVICLNHTVCSKNIDDSFVIDITDIYQCHQKIHPITVSNVSLKIINKKIALSGILTTLKDLSSPLKAHIEIEKDELGFWIKMPCLKKVGSCSYEDLCEFGISMNETCPKLFTDNHVPCRCPVARGIYTIPPIFNLSLASYLRHNTLITGKYWANISAEHNGQVMTCYEVYFNIKRLQSVYKMNDIKPSIIKV